MADWSHSQCLRIIVIQCTIARLLWSNPAWANCLLLCNSPCGLFYGRPEPFCNLYHVLASIFCWWNQCQLFHVYFCDTFVTFIACCFPLVVYNTITQLMPLACMLVVTKQPQDHPLPGLDCPKVRGRRTCQPQDDIKFSPPQHFLIWKGTSEGSKLKLSAAADGSSLAVVRHVRRDLWSDFSTQKVRNQRKSMWERWPNRAHHE
jgi:hypothetical protein